MIDKAFKGFTNTQYAQYLNQFFKAANKKYFGDKLTKPRFSQLKNMKDPRSYGLFIYNKFDPTHLEIKISPRLLRNKKLHDETVLHEMCHQATYQIDGDTDGGHGYNWQKWMKKCKLPPEQYFSKEKADLLKTPLEKEIEKRQQREREEAKKIKDTKETIPYYQLTTKLPCQFFINDKWIEGLLVNPSGRDRWIIAWEQGAFKIVNENIKQVPKDRYDEITKKCEYQYQRFMKDAERRKERRDDMKHFRSIAKGLGYR